MVILCSAAVAVMLAVSAFAIKTGPAGCWSVPASAVHIVDGDTFDAEVHIWLGLTQRERIRVLGVDTPEMTGGTREAGSSARTFTATWLSREDIRLNACRRDVFGRVLATVTRERDGADLTQALISAGHGVKR